VQKQEAGFVSNEHFPQGLQNINIKKLRAENPGRAETRDLRSLLYMSRTSLTIFLAVSMAATVGCTSKNYVKQQTTPLINKTNELDDMTAKNSKDIKDVDARAQAGIQAVNAKTADVEQKAQAANQSATSAQQMADAANNRVGVLTNTVANLDNYRPVAETSVKFGFNRDNLTPKAMEALDQLAGTISSTKGYIIALEGSTDSVGSADYNYDLSQRRANSVTQYLAAKYNVPAHKIYVIGLGKDKPVETNKTREGRADNRRVDVRLMTNTVGDTTQPTTVPTTTGQNNPSSM
jgi:outer membrane protein OmpA-like peptidoglycan-associated protein